MSITATYTDADAKVTVAVTSAPANASTVLLERSTNKVNWTAVRGAQPFTLTAGAVSQDDWEFTDGVVNYYRATYYDSSTPATVGSPAAATVTTSAGASATVTPSMPTGLGLGDVVFVAVANTKATATVGAAPTGWNLVAVDADGLGLYTADWTASLTMPAFSVTGLASGDKVVGKAFAYRNVTVGAANVQAQVNASAANIAYPAFGALPGSLNLGPMVVFQRSTHTSVSPVATYDDHATGYAIMVYAENPATTVGGTITVTGGSAATSSVIQANLSARAFSSQETGTVTPALSTTWIKDPLAPYLNRKITPISVDPVTNPARSATFDIIARTNPVAVTDLYGSRQTALQLRTVDPVTMQDLHDCLMSGHVQFVHAPAGARTPTGYFVLGDLTVSYPAQTSSVRYLDLKLTEVAAPDPSLAGVIGTWNTVISTYATWADLVAAKATWADVLLLVGSPTEIITD
jgi:hypothetical protein